MAYGAAGPMLLPATLELLRVKRLVVPPHPGLFSALGLLSTDLVYYDSRSAYVVLVSGDGADDLGGLRGHGGAAARQRPASGRTASPSGAASTGASSGRAGRRRSSRCPRGRSTEETIPELIDRFHDEYERRYGNRFEYVPVQGVTYRVQLVVPAEKVEYRAQQIGAALEPEPIAGSSCVTSRTVP